MTIRFTSWNQTRLDLSDAKIGDGITVGFTNGSQATFDYMHDSKNANGSTYRLRLNRSWTDEDVFVMLMNHYEESLTTQPLLRKLLLKARRQQCPNWQENVHFYILTDIENDDQDHTPRGRLPFYVVANSPLLNNTDVYLDNLIVEMVCTG